MPTQERRCHFFTAEQWRAWQHREKQAWLKSLGKKH